MAKIGLTEGFTLVPEGTHVFKITKVVYKEEFGKLEVSMQTQGGTTHVERFSLLKNDGSPNEGALNAFSYFAKVVLDDFSLTEIDHNDLIGHFIECDIEHETQENTKKPGKTVTFARLSDKRASDGWEEDAPDPAPKATPKAAPAEDGKPKPKVDLNALLG